MMNGKNFCYKELEVLIGARVRRGSSEKYAEEKHHINKSCWIEISQEEEAAGASKSYLGRSRSARFLGN